jgi:predicted protein tyrosine phosphatase
VCSAGLLRSPTAAVVLSQPPFNHNTRAAGAEDSYALIPVDKVLICWSDEVVCMTSQHRSMLLAKFPSIEEDVGDIIVLNIPDNFAYRDPALMLLIAEAYTKSQYRAQ